jgi:peptidyl-prolyl isomerase G (cyclophilin G)
VFGKVIRGYDVVKQVAEVPVDEKDRPLSPVVISNCGELELRKPPGALTHTLLETDFTIIITPAIRPQTPESNSETADLRQSRRSHPRPRSRSSDGERPRRKKSKKQKAPEDEKEEVEELTSKFTVEETEEEYDARLEREENERIEAEKKRELERIKRKYDSEIQNSNGIRFKG